MIFYLMVLLVLYGTLAPLGSLSSGLDLSFLPYQDKIVHILMFVVLGFLVLPSYPKINRLTLGIVLSIYGFVIEILQYWLPTGRTFEMIDWVADTFGVVIGFSIYNILNVNLILKNKQEK